MTSSLHVHFLPSLVTPEELAGGAVVVIDVLRASTTIVHALAAGANAVIPCGDIDEARRVAANQPAGTAVLGGERGCLKVEGFDIGNSPNDCTPETVGGKTVVISTTNGTRAIERCRKAGQVIIGAFVNIDAVLKRLQGHGVVHLLCAGCEGQVTREDVLYAGALVNYYLYPPGVEDETLNDSARIARSLWNATQWQGLPEDQFREQLFRELMNSQGAANLVKVGYERDIRTAAQFNAKGSTLPVLDLKTWRISSR